MANNEYHKNYNLTRYHDKMNRAREILGNKCNKCGSTENLEIDHINREDKKYEMTTITRLSEDNFIKELAKCQLLCKDCHIKKTAEDFGVGHGEGLSGKKNCKCDLCKAKKNAYMKQYNKIRTSLGIKRKRDRLF